MNAKTSRSIIDAPTVDNPAMAAFESWINMNRPVMEAMSELNGRWIEQVSKANSEWLGFVNRRLNEDIAASQRIMECKTLQDLFAAYSDFFQRAQQQYQAEFQYFSRLNQKLADETASVMKSRMDEVDAEMRH
jgi:hypothetical protein